MSIQVTCPHCSKTINAPDKFAGKSANCPGCKNAIQIPSADDDFEVPDFGATETVDVGPARIDLAPAGPKSSPYVSPRSASSPDRGELQRVKIVGIRIPFMDVMILVLQMYAVGFVLSLVAFFIFGALMAAVGVRLGP